jgi:hypothetical protein
MPTNEFEDWKRYKAKERSLQQDFLDFIKQKHDEVSGEYGPMMLWGAVIDLALTITLLTHGPDNFRHMWIWALESAEKDERWMKEREGRQWRS